MTPACREAHLMECILSCRLITRLILHSQDKFRPFQADGPRLYHKQLHAQMPGNSKRQSCQPQLFQYVFYELGKHFGGGSGDPGQERHP